MVVVADDNIPLLDRMLRHCGKYHHFSGRTLTREVLRDTGCVALFVRSTTRVNEALLDGTQVRFCATATAGSDHVDTDYLRRRGIHFFAAEGSNSNAVAEYVIWAILHWAENLRGERETLEEFLSGKTLGIVGYGHVGSKVALYARRLHLTVLVNDPPLRQNHVAFPEFTAYAGLDEICAVSDIVTNHVPLASAGEFPTRGLFSKKEIAMLRDGSLFVHASRGGVVDEAALLARREIFAAVDVWEDEPCVNSKLVSAVWIATPHIAGHSREAKRMGARMVAGEFGRWYGCSPDFSPLDGETNTPEKGLSLERLYRILCERRRIGEDSDLFKAKISAGDTEFFDEFRRNYPERIETLRIDDGY